MVMLPSPVAYPAAIVRLGWGGVNGVAGTLWTWVLGTWRGLAPVDANALR